MAENNFALIIVGIVAIVAVVGILNFNGATGMNPTNVIQTATEEELYLTEWECKGCDENGNNCVYNCAERIVETNTAGESSYNFYACEKDSMGRVTKWCHRSYYRTG